MSEELKEGWLHLPNATKWHYFKKGRSLCSKWMAFGKKNYQLGNDDSPDNCKVCQTKLTKLKENGS